ncbi:hypothetical protein F5878DRAFT_547798 [Lentinula raphanica]|uniref:Uncharacterized protein n=1 Tax=Lentinula raphanica TaxID=153919 RepID=A0AA38NXY9_9AGAR|nr:hypothetical protein F5878DRAFT_547798 [Lentinula raphanica]
MRTDLVSRDNNSDEAKYRFVKHNTTARRHLASSHRKKYEKFCKDNNFISMLPSDTATRRAEQLSKLTQTNLDAVVELVERKEPVIMYSDEAFSKAALEWLVCTDQPISAFQHEKFRAMILVASRATGKVKIPGRKLTRQGIMNLYWDIMRAMKEKFAVRTILIIMFSLDIHIQGSRTVLLDLFLSPVMHGLLVMETLTLL